MKQHSERRMNADAKATVYILCQVGIEENEKEDFTDGGAGKNDFSPLVIPDPLRMADCYIYIRTPGYNDSIKMNRTTSFFYRAFAASLARAQHQEADKEKHEPGGESRRVCLFHCLTSS